MPQPASREVLTAASRTPAQRRRAFWVTLIAFLLLAGAFFLYLFADRFVFRFANSYTKIALVSAILSMPFVLYLLERNRRFGEEFSKKYPTTWLRNWVIMPLIAAIPVGLVFAAPLGWLFAAAAWCGGPVHHVSAIAVDVGTFARRKHCDQYATLRLPSGDKETCLDYFYRPATMREGQVLDVGLVVFPFGHLIVSIAPAGPEWNASRAITTLLNTR